MECFFRSLKIEWVPTAGNRTFNKAREHINDYIIGYYNDVRPRRYNAVLAPNESERRFSLDSKTLVNMT